MATNQWRGDAPAVAQELLLTAPTVAGVVEFTIGGRPLGFNATWSSVTSATTQQIVNAWNASTLPEFREITASVSSYTYTTDTGSQLTIPALKLTAKTPGTPFEVVATLNGTNATSEVQTITLLNSPTGGTWAINFDGQTTSGLAHNASASTVQTALEALSNLAPGDVTVTLAGNVYTLQFGGVYAGQNVPPVSVTYLSTLTGGNCSIVVSTVTPGELPVNEIQRLTSIGTPTGGTSTVTVPGLPAATLAWNSSSSAAQTAFDTAIGAGKVTVTGGPFPGTPLDVEFIGTLAGQDLGLMTTDATGLTGTSASISVANTTAGVAGTNAKYRLALNGNPATPDSGGRTGFKWRISVPLGGGLDWYSDLIDYTATNDQIKAALQDLRLFFQGAYGSPAFPGASGITVTGTLNNTWTTGYLELEFVGQWASRPITVLVSEPSGSETTEFNAQNRNVSINRTTVSAGLAGTNKVQTLTQSGSPSGNFRLRLSGQTTIPIPYGSTATVIAQALAQLSTAGVSGAPSEANRPSSYRTAPEINPYTLNWADNVVVAGGALGAAGVTLTYAGGGLQSSNSPAIEVIEADVAVTTTQTGFAGVAEVQSVTLSTPVGAAAPRSGTWTLTYSGQTTAGIALAAGSTDIRTALESLSNIDPGDVVVTGTSLSSGLSVRFRAGLGDVAQMTGSGAGLNNNAITVATGNEGGQLITQYVLKESRGPWHGDDPLNWTLGHVPDSGEDLLFQFGSTGPRWGCTWRSTFTINISDATRLNCRNHLRTGQKVWVKSSGTLPTGLNASTEYYVIRTDAESIQLATTLGGTPISLSGGSGTHQVFVKLAGIKTKSSWSGYWGTQWWNPNGYAEYRPLYLSCGFVDNARVTVGEGNAGSGSPLTRLDSGDFPIAIEILTTQGAKETSLPAFLWKGNNDANTVELIDGTLGIAVLSGETAHLARLTVRSGEAEIGELATFISGGVIDVTGGSLKSLAVFDGTLKIRGN